MAIEAEHEANRHEGNEIPQNWPQTVREQLTAVMMRLEPTRCLLHRLQHAGAQVLEALWLGSLIRGLMGSQSDGRLARGGGPSI